MPAFIEPPDLSHPCSAKEDLVHLRFDFYNVVLNSATTALVRKGARRLRPSSLRIGGRFHREPGAR